jgi:hypothetical protein
LTQPCGGNRRADACQTAADDGYFGPNRFLFHVYPSPYSEFDISLIS